MRPVSNFACLAFALLASTLSAARTPDWVMALKNVSVPSYWADAPAVVLTDVSEMEISRSGEIESRIYYAVRIQDPEGRDYAKARISYNSKTDKVRDLDAWLILPDGEVRTYKDRDFVRAEASDYKNVYDETWRRSLSVASAAVPGSIFAWSARVQEQDISPQRRWWFQQEIPVVTSRLQLDLPEGWLVTAHPINEPKFEYQHEGTRHTWTAAFQPALEHEEWQPRNAGRPFLGINLFPSERDRNRARMATYTDWHSIAATHAPILDAAAQPDDAVRAKVAELTHDCPTQWEKIRAVARYCQNVNYTSISLDLSQGGGYRPFPAPMVLSRNYGDCKDKTALLRAMLSCLNVESYAVLCLSSDDEDVFPQWPSPTAFNHCVTALRVPDGVEGEGLVDSPELGKLLIFDPTNDYVPIGSIGEEIAGSFALITTEQSHVLQALPHASRHISLSLEGTLSPRGALSGTVTEISEGSEAIWGRGAYRNLGTSRYEQALFNWLRSEAAASELGTFEVSDDMDSDVFQIVANFEASAFARPLGTTMLIVKPFVGSRRLLKPDFGTERRQPIALPYISSENSARILLPEGFTVDELPKPVKLEETFGTVEVSYEETEGALVAHRKVLLNGAVVPVDGMERLDAFFDAYQKAGQGRIVIKRL